MIVIKFIGFMLIFTATTLAGFIYGEKFKKRVVQLYEFQRCVYELQNQIIYTRTPLPEAILEVANKSNHYIDKLLKKISILLCTNKVDDVYSAFIKAFKDMKNYIYMNKEDINIILDLAKSLGKSDVEGQKSIFSLTIENIKKQIAQAELMMNKNVKMYRSLGFFTGAMIIIIMI